MILSHIFPGNLIAKTLDWSCMLAMFTMPGVYDPNLLNWAGNFIHHMTSGIANIPTIAGDFASAVTGGSAATATAILPSPPMIYDGSAMCMTAQ